MAVTTNLHQLEEEDGENLRTTNTTALTLAEQHIDFFHSYSLFRFLLRRLHQRHMHHHRSNITTTAIQVIVVLIIIIIIRINTIDQDGHYRRQIAQ